MDGWVLGKPVGNLLQPSKGKKVVTWKEMLVVRMDDLELFGVVVW